jgi:hypothetical protein
MRETGGIDILKEALITPPEAAELYPGGPVDVSHVYRDIKVGHGGIRLEHLRTPRIATSREAVARFFAALTAAHATPRPPGGRPSTARRARADRLVDD